MNVIATRTNAIATRAIATRTNAIATRAIAIATPIVIAGLDPAISRGTHIAR